MIRTRFPPEPNGFLHLGHVKSIYHNFNYPLENGGGECLLRFDDTNPETEKQIYVDNILEDVKWMGYTPSKITYTSDYFDQLYDYALQLIKKGIAYVDESTGEDISNMRKMNISSPYRNRPIDENLELFDKMYKKKQETS